MVAERILKLDCPLGPDTFLLNSFTGTEGISQLFGFELDLSSAEHAIAPADIIGKAVTITVVTEALGKRHFHGRVRQLAAGEVDPNGLRRYRASVVPWLWLLTKRQGCRIFQGKTPTDIAEALFGELGFSDYRLQVRGQQPTLEYCVQYRESDFAFLSRLLEEHGIFYHFEHSDSAHTLVLSDAKSAFTDCDEASVVYSTSTRPESCVLGWERAWEFTSGATSARDYDFTKSQTTLEATVSTVVKLDGLDPYEVYDHPGTWSDSAVGDAKVKAWMEAEESTHDLASGVSTCISFRPTGKFTLAEHPVDSENTTWVVLSVSHHAAEPSSGAEEAYSNRFQCMLASGSFRPARRTPRPLIHGLQTALVVGPSGEEIHTDEHGRIRVQFHWDREGQKDEASSCWIRVAQPWAGKSFGAFHLPRIGQEVVVAFMEGDPDRPLVVGSVYNDVQTPPFGLPASKTQTGLRTRSTPDGGADNCNEISFEDKAGEERLFIHAEKDELHEVENDAALDIGHDQTIKVGNNRSETVEKDRTLTVNGNKSETVEKDKTIAITGSHEESVKQEMTISVDGSRALSVKKDLTESVDGNRSETTKKDLTVKVDGLMQLAVGKDMTFDVGKSHAQSAKENFSLKAKKISIQADDELVIKVGSATVTLKKSGDVTIEGGKITLKGSSDVIVKGSKVAMN